MLPNIMFIGKMRSGKDTAYKILEEAGYNVLRVAYGDVMKEKFYELFPQFIGKPKPTKEIIHFGQSMRQIDRDIWVNLTIGGLKVHDLIRDQYGLEKPSLVFTDVRQYNEYEACKEQGCVVVRIFTDEETQKYRMEQLGEKPTQEILKAGTETELDEFDFDYYITNGGNDLEKFKAQILAIAVDLEARMS